MFERPKKNDLDTALSMLMHESRHKLMEEVSRVKSDAIKAGALQGNRVVVTAIKAADDVHKVAMEQANTILLDFIERMQRAPSEIVGWARPHLENLNNSVLGVVPPNGFPQDHQRLTRQYRVVFQQRLDIMLRNVEIGHQKGSGFARAEKVESKEEWISAAAAIQILKPVLKSEYAARMRICARAHAGLIRGRADRFMMDNRSQENFEIPKEFCWAEGHEALKQDWEAGDFDTWLKETNHLRAFGVSFLRADIEKLIVLGSVKPAPPRPAPAVGGRKPADWWEDCLLDLAFQHFRGDLKAESQADLIRAMQAWMMERGFDAADSTVKIRARKLMDAINRENEIDK
jgi:hypothetical protein